MQAKSSPKVRRAVLGLALYKHPVAMTAADLRREFGDDAAAAVADLQAAGLLRREGDSLRPTCAALSFYRLELP